MSDASRTEGHIPFAPHYRASGVLVHITSLPSAYGIGDVGPAAFAMVDRLQAAGQSWWQALPLGPTGYGNSPYQSLSSFAGNGLLIMDAAGKDGAIKHVMSGVNPQGCQVYSFKSPSAEDLDHDYLWRCVKCLPERGRIGIFNRSYYEETLVVRVHPELLAKQKIPQQLITKDIWDERYRDIRHFEHYLSRNGVVIRKFFLHVSAAEQKKRFLERLDNSAKNWKVSAADSRERGFWKEYMEAYEDMIGNTATDYAPWYVVPADNKWFTRVVVAAVVIDALASLNLQYPEVSAEQRKQLAVVKEALIADDKR
jgi:PPK2 family polyphosphate:nucleotide phosphotransferase